MLPSISSEQKSDRTPGYMHSVSTGMLCQQYVVLKKNFPTAFHNCVQRSIIVTVKGVRSPSRPDKADAEYEKVPVIDYSLLLIFS